MKTNIIILVQLLFGFHSMAQNSNLAMNSKFEKAMLENISKMDTASAQTLVILANNFERIGNAEKTKWEPFYYAAYSYTSLAYTSDKSKIDELADQAEKFARAAELLVKNNSEISVLFAMINSCRIMVDPVARFQIKGREVAMFIEKARQENVENPRIYLQEARVQLRTPEAFGGGKKVAKASVEKAMAKFAAFKAETTISPSWGEQQAIQLHKAINN